MDKISVVIPVYNTEQFLERCIDSVLAQTYPNLEVILVDDGSQDNCGLICDQYAHQDNRVKVIHKRNGGVSSARNCGLDVASGDYITFVDSDDYIDPNMYESMINIAKKYQCELVMCDCIKEFEDKTELFTHDIRGGFYDEEQLLNEYYPHLLIMPNIEYPPTISNWLCLFKNRRINGRFSLHYEEGIRYSEDWLFGSQLIYSVSSFYYMKGKAFYHYCMNMQSATHVFIKDKWNDYQRLYKKIENVFGQRTDFDFRSQVDRCLLFLLLNAVGDIYASEISYKDKIYLINNIITTEDVKKVFKRISIKKLQIPIKMKILLWCYKHEVGVSIFIKYFDSRKKG